MTEPMSDERLAGIRRFVEKITPRDACPGDLVALREVARDLLTEAERLRAALADTDWDLGQTEIARRNERDRADRAEARLAHATELRGSHTEGDDQ